MQKTAKLKIKGEMTFSLKDKNGVSKKLWNENVIGKLFRELGKEVRMPFLTGFYGDKMVVNNIVTNAGLAEITNLLGNVSTPTEFTYLAVGIGTTAVDATDTALESEIVDSGLERAAATVSQEDTTVTDDTLQLLKTWSVTGSKAVTECGALNDASAGTLLGHQVFAAINVADGDSLLITYKFVVANA